MKGLIAIIGPTSIGKTRVAIQLAQTFGGEIINGDSRQVYRFMDIGTAKPSLEQQALIPHYLLDVVHPDEPFSLAIYQKLAYEHIENIQGNNHIPFLVGGSGLYIWSIIEGWRIPEVPPDNDFRKKLECVAEEKGSYFLYRKLKNIDPVAANKISPNNIRRIIRALEIYQTTGNPPSHSWDKKLPAFPILIIGLTTDRNTLYQMIDMRVDTMIDSGFVEEVNKLIKKGYNSNLSSLSSIGYRQIYLYIKGALNLAEAVKQIKYETHRFARHQYAWFHLIDKRIKWFDIGGDYQESINLLVSDFIKNK